MNETFVPLDTEKRKELVAALKSNAEGEAAMLVGKDTSFSGLTTMHDEETVAINKIKSIPTHY